MRFLPSIGCLILVLTSISCGNTGGVEDLHRQARAAWTQGKREQALELATKAIQQAPKNAMAYLFRGQLYAGMAKHQEAIADFDKAIELDPKLAEAFDQRGSEQFKLGRFAESLADFDRYLQLRPEEQPGHWRRGITCYYARKFDEGQKQFEGYQTFDSNDVENAVWRFLCMARSQGVDKARAALLKVGEDKRVPMKEIYALFSGEAKEADVLAAANRGNVNAEERNRRLFYAHLYLGLYHEAHGDAKRAQEHLTKAADEHKIGHYMWDVARVHAELLKKKAVP